MNENLSQQQHFKLVDTFSQLVETPFSGKINALCWKRALHGDFKEIVSKLNLTENITEVSGEELCALQLSDNGNVARKIILNDLRLLSEFGAAPTLNLLKNYERDEEFDFIKTDVYSYHADRSPVATDTFLCTYSGASGDIISNDHVMQKILIPEVRQKLKKLHSGSEAEFGGFLRENYFDMHYEPKPGAVHTNLGNGNLWRLAVDFPEQPVLPCIHRAPIENKGEYRLLLIC